MKITINKKKLFFETSGHSLKASGGRFENKPTLILLHGSPGNSDHSVFRPMFDQLSDIAQVIYIDLAGSGRSDNPEDGVFSLESWADDLYEFCEALSIEKPVVLGNSAGGMIAAQYGIKYPNHPGKLILSSTQGRLTTSRCLSKFEELGGIGARLSAERALVTHGDLESFIEYAKVCMPLYNVQPQTRERLSIFRRSCADAFHKLGGVWHQLDLLDEVHRITCPTLILAGEEDPVTPCADSEDLMSRMNSEWVQLRIFPHAGHGVWLDDQEAAFHAIREFIQEERR